MRDLVPPSHGHRQRAALLPRTDAVTRHERGARRRLVALALAALVAAAIACIVDLTGVLSSLERATIATRFSLRDEPRPTGIVLVKIDDRTFGELAHSWPFPRSWHGRVIDRLRAAGAREIVYDVQFTEPSQLPSEDLALYDAIARARNVTLATSESDAQGRTNVLGGDANLARAHARAAAANLSTSTGGVVTRFPRSVSGLDSLAVVAAERATGRRLPGGALPRRRGLDRLPRRRRHVPVGLVLRRAARAAYPPRRSAARSSSSVRPRPRCRTCTRRRSRAAT